MTARPPPPPKTGIALLDSVLGDAARTRRLVTLLLAAGIAISIVIVPLAVVACLLGVAGAVTAGGVGTLATATFAVLRTRKKPIK
jgi:hypothetical protein